MATTAAPAAGGESTSTAMTTAYLRAGTAERDRRSGIANADHGSATAPNTSVCALLRAPLPRGSALRGGRRKPLNLICNGRSSSLGSFLSPRCLHSRMGVLLRWSMKVGSRFRILAGLLVCLSSPAAGQPVDSRTCGVNPGENLIVFVGQKIELRKVAEPHVDEHGWQMDYKFRATYEVFDLVCGDYASPQIKFDIYDHYGTPEFAQFETVLLYVSRYDGRLVHQKYAYDAVYETTDGSWAGCGDPYKNDPEVHRGSIRAEPIDYEREVSFSVSGLSEAEIQKRYPSEYFRRKGDVVICEAGARVADLFAIKREGVLKARGLFE